MSKDFVPAKPTQPILKKQSSVSLQVQFQIPSNGGSEVTRVHLALQKLDPNSTEFVKERELEVEHGLGIEVILDGLEPEGTYRVQVQALNPVGASEPSEWSENVNLDALVPKAPEPRFEVLSSTSLALLYSNLFEITKPPLMSVCMYWCQYPRPSDSLKEEDISTLEVPIHESSLIKLDGLKEGESYHVWATFKGQNGEEGISSDPVYIPLSSFLSLPDSPPPSPPPPASSSKESLNKIQKVPNSFRRSSSLSLDQRFQNMHDGMPAHFDPEDPEASVAGAPLSRSFSNPSQPGSRKPSISEKDATARRASGASLSSLNRKPSQTSPRKASVGSGPKATSESSLSRPPNAPHKKSSLSSSESSIRPGAAPNQSVTATTSPIMTHTNDLQRKGSQKKKLDEGSVGLEKCTLSFRPNFSNSLI